MVTFLRWLFSNSGAIRGAPDVQSQYLFMRAKRPLMEKKCPYCGCVYWAFATGNKYCGGFKCFREMLKRRRNE